MFVVICAIYDIVLLIHVCLYRRLVILQHFAQERTTFCKPTVVLTVVPSVMQTISPEVCSSPTKVGCCD